MRWFMRPGISRISGCSEPAEGDVHLLQAPANAEQRDAAGHTGDGQRQRHLITVNVVGLVPFTRIDIEAGRMDVSPGAGEHDPVDHIEQRAEIGDVGCSRKHHRQAAGNLGHRTQIAFADHLDLKSIFDAMGVPDHADDRLSHLPFRPLQ
ncbi:hypothetical protein ACVWW3_002821 [Bradyrhizobium sp. LM2.9]